MPLDDEIIEENPPESEEGTSDNPADYPTDTDDPEVDGDDSLVQDEESGFTAPKEGQSEPDDEELDSEPEISPDEIISDDGISDETVSDETLLDESISDETVLPEKEYILPAADSISDNFIENQEYEVSYSSETVEVYSDLEAFEASTIQVDLYQYTILNRLEFIQYALCIVIALLFLQIFVRYKK